MYDDEKAAYDVTRRLIEKGHKKIGALSGPLTSYHSQKRLRGFQKALFDTGILYNADAVCYGDWSRISGYNAAEKLVQQNCTAVFAFNDLMASGIYEWCSTHQLEVGDDISLFGFDNRDICCGYSHKISTVEPPLNEIGRTVAGLVLQQIQGKALQPERLLLPCTIIDRESVGPAKTSNGAEKVLKLT